MRTKCFGRLFWKSGNVLKEKSPGGPVNSATSVATPAQEWYCVMFVLVEMVDTVRIAPWDFQRQINEAIAEELNKKLANKVSFKMQNAHKTFIYQFGKVTPLLNAVLIHWSPQVVYNVGLCVCLYDITKLEDSYIFPGDGASHTKGLMEAKSYINDWTGFILYLIFIFKHFSFPPHYINTTVSSHLIQQQKATIVYLCLSFLMREICHIGTFCKTFYLFLLLFW